MKLKKIWKFILIMVLLSTVAYASYFCYKEYKELFVAKKKEIKKVEEPKIKTYKLSMALVGDALYHSTVYKDGFQSDKTYNYDHQLTYITELLKNYDLKYYNQESILGGTELGLSTYPRFNSPYEVGDAYVKAGFNLVSLANNHTLDRGEKAILNSINYWKTKNDIMTAGSYYSVEDRTRSHVATKNNITYAFLSYTTLTNGLRVPEGKDYLVNVYSDEKAKADIEALPDNVDIIIVAIHWGIEYSHTPSEQQRTIANYLSSLGVDIIAGTHPHVVQPIEHINNTVVFYSLGNFISAQIGIERLIGLFGSLDITKTVNGNIVDVKIDNIKGDLLYTYYRNWRNFKVIPFCDLDEIILKNKNELKIKYEAIINKNDPTVTVGSLGLNQ